MENMYSKLRKTLMDKESEIIFDARIAYMETGNVLTFIKKMHDLYKDFEYPTLDHFIERNGEKPIVIFGAGYEGGIAVEIIKHTQYASCLYGICDNNKELWGEEKYGFPVMSIYDLLTKDKEVIYILASSRYNYQFLCQLLNLGVYQENIFISQYGGFLAAQRGWQYFDVFQPYKHEVFIDAGAYDGKTSKEFINWCHGEYDSIYMFELNEDMKSVCYRNLETDKKIFFTGKGVWNKNSRLRFWDSQSAAHIDEKSSDSENGNFAQVCTIDSEVMGENITFIKMDVEGSELKALQGAQNTIKKLKPRLAISVYHKLDDTVNIMKYLLELNPEYRFYLRHYSACQWETVLYAVSG